MRRDWQDRVLAEDAVLAGGPVDRPAERRGKPLLVGRTAVPAREETADHAVAHLPARDARADFGDFARAVGEGDEVAALLLRAVAALDGEQVAVVERCGAQAHQHFAVARARLRPLDDRQIIKPKRFYDGDLHMQSVGCGKLWRPRGWAVKMRRGAALGKTEPSGASSPGHAPSRFRPCNSPACMSRCSSRGLGCATRHMQRLLVLVAFIVAFQLDAQCRHHAMDRLQVLGR